MTVFEVTVVGVPFTTSLAEADAVPEMLPLSMSACVMKYLPVQVMVAPAPIEFPLQVILVTSVSVMEGAVIVEVDVFVIK